MRVVGVSRPRGVSDHDRGDRSGHTESALMTLRTRVQLHNGRAVCLSRGTFSPPLNHFIFVITPLFLFFPSQRLLAGRLRSAGSFGCDLRGRYV